MGKYRFNAIFFGMLFLGAIGAYGQAQGIYYDKHFNTISNQKTPYYRTYNETDSGLAFTDFSGDSIVARGYAKAPGSSPHINDAVQFARGLGNPYRYKKGIDGIRCEVDFYDNGKICKKVVSHSGKIFYGQIWDPTGKTLLVKGTGDYVHPNKESTTHEHYKDSALTEAYSVRTVQGDTIHQTYDKMAVPEGGYQSFMTELTGILKYPGIARLANKEGVVYIQFYVDKNGKLTELKPISEEGFNLEKRSLEKLSKMPDWEPGVFNGKPIKMAFVLPIRFKLTDRNQK